MSQPKMRMRDAVTHYITRLEGERKSAATIRTASYALKRLLTWLESERMPNLYAHLFDLGLLEKYLFAPGGVMAGGHGRPVSNATFNQQRGVLNSFFVYCVQRKWMDDNPIVTVKRMKKDERTPKLLLSSDEMLQLLVGANPRDRAVLAVCMNTGLRAGDLCSLSIGDANLTNGLLAAEIHKTRKFDQKPITMELEAELRLWLDWYSHLTQVPVAQLPNDWTLLPPVAWNPHEFETWQLKQRGTITHPERIIHRALKRVGITAEREGLHLLRRSSARHLFEMLLRNDEARDRALLIVRDYLNHSSVVITELYIGLNHERVIRDKVLRGQSFLAKTQDSSGGELISSTFAEGQLLGEQQSG